MDKDPRKLFLEIGFDSEHIDIPLPVLIAILKDVLDELF